MKKIFRIIGAERGPGWYEWFDKRYALLIISLFAVIRNSPQFFPSTMYYIPFCSILTVGKLTAVEPFTYIELH